MNEFYSIGVEGKDLDSPLQLKNLGKKRLFAMFGGSGGTQKTYVSVTVKDYDFSFANRITSTYPPYNVEMLLNFHFDIYLSTHKNGKSVFLNHIRYVVLPIIKGQKGKDVYVDIVNKWIEEKETVVKRKSNSTRVKKSANHKNTKLIFISHAVKDKEIADAFVDVILHGALSVPINEIFCVSTDGTKIDSGDDWRDSIKRNILSAKINFLLITPHYKESEVCMNEMGAAWMTEACVLPLIIEPINYQSVGVIQQPKQIEKLLDEGSLDRIKDVVQKELKIDNELIKSDRWTAKKKEFLLRVKSYLQANKFETPIDRQKFKELERSNGDLEKAITSLIEEKRMLESLVEDLKGLKDKKEVSIAIKKHQRLSYFEEFENICKQVHDKLVVFPSIIVGIVFKSYTLKSIEIGWQNSREDLDDALANDYIDEELNVKWKATKLMKEIEVSLDNVKNFIARESLDNDFYEAYEESYSVSLDIGNKQFWEQCFKVSISFR